ncbi:MAG TPA: DegQ family serine endoprotease [Deltaproteobacteria bacterium]|nr:DegQ family serine endoprotease [Deltaproteobacteria bacterium]HQI80128.1 DegQ family serine endoprotease [Deltaproteobacteria bacterium]
MTKTLVYEDRRVHPWKMIGLLLLGITLALAAAPLPANGQEKALESLRETGKAFASVAKKASPAVVFISVEKSFDAGRILGPATPFDDGFFPHRFGWPLPEQPQGPQQKRRMVQGQGSGFIITPDGYILTNNHVVGEADRVSVKLLDGREFTARTVGTDPPTDVAVIKIDAGNLPVLPLGDSDSLEVGEWVLALGNPFGLSHTLTAGIVSAKGRSHVGITDYEDFIQTDAAINPGNSGGPLIDLAGRVVGINTAMYSRSGGYMGIGFAIPVSLARDIYTRLIDHGEVTRGYLGIMVQDLTPELAKSFKVPGTRGVLVSDVMPDTPAQRAGLKQGDVIVRLNRENTDTVGTFRSRIALMEPGSRADLAVIRDGRERSIPVTVGKMPAPERKASARSRDIDAWGLSVSDLARDQAAHYGYTREKGVIVTAVEPGSPAAQAGIRKGSLIQEVNRSPVKDSREFKEAVEGKKTLLLLVRDAEGARYVTLDLKG